MQMKPVMSPIRRKMIDDILAWARVGAVAHPELSMMLELSGPRGSPHLMLNAARNGCCGAMIFCDPGGQDSNHRRIWMDSFNRLCQGAFLFIWATHEASARSMIVDYLQSGTQPQVSH